MVLTGATSPEGSSRASWDSAAGTPGAPSAPTQPVSRTGTPNAAAVAVTDFAEAAFGCASYALTTARSFPFPRRICCTARSRTWERGSVSGNRIRFTRARTKLPGSSIGPTTVSTDAWKRGPESGSPASLRESHVSPTFPRPFAFACASKSAFPFDALARISAAFFRTTSRSFRPKGRTIRETSRCSSVRNRSGFASWNALISASDGWTSRPKRSGVNAATASFTRAGVRKRSFACSYFASISPSVGGHHQEPDLPRGDPEQLLRLRFRDERPRCEETLDFFQRDLDPFRSLELGGTDAVIGEDGAIQVVPELPVLLERGNGGDLPLHLLVRGRQSHFRGLFEKDLLLDQGVHRRLLQVERIGHLGREGGSVHLPVGLLEAGDGLGQLVRGDRLSAHGGGHVPALFGVGADSPPDEGQRDEGEDDLDGPGAGVAAEYGEHGGEVLLSMEMNALPNVPF